MMIRIGSTYCALFVISAVCPMQAFVATSSPTYPVPSAARGTTPGHVLMPLKSTSSSHDAATGSEAKVDDVAMESLQEAVGFNPSAASDLLAMISRMREDGTSRETIDAFLDEILRKGPDSNLPIWARSKRLARFSRRARMASLRRTLDRTTPPLSENEEGADDSKQVAQRRRRALLALLRSLSIESDDGYSSKEPCIVRLERRAIKAEKDDATNLRNRLPDGLETPKYDVVAPSISGGKNVEIRHYKPYSVCAVSMNKPRPTESTKTDAKIQMPEMSGASSFGALAGYLFGKNDQSTAMKMTTPVFTSPLQEGDRQMEFVLPSTYWDSVGSAPRPLSESGVTLQEKASEDRAVIMFGGYASQKEVKARKKELFAALSKDPEWRMLAEEATVAQYNDPFTVPWKRLNEVSVGVERR